MKTAISVVTYTYNDHNFVFSLLKYLRSFGLPFAEVIIVDDASTPPFSLELLAHWKTRILRVDENIGPGQAKRVGLSAARGDVVLSLDADIRPHAKWPLHSLSLLRDRTVGLVGSACIPSRTSSYLGAALNRTSSPLPGDTEVDFVPAGCMMFRKLAWDFVGGLADFSGRAYEDYQISRKFARHNFRILQNKTHPVYETRHLHRTTWCKRVVHYECSPILLIVEKYGVERYLQDCVPALATAMDYFDRHGNPVLFYVLLLKLAYLFHVLIQEAPGNIGLAALRDALWQSVRAVIATSPKTLGLLGQDLAVLETSFIQGSSPSLPPLDALMARFAPERAVNALERKWIDAFKEEDLIQTFDSHYTGM